MLSGPRDQQFGRAEVLQEHAVQMYERDRQGKLLYHVPSRPLRKPGVDTSSDQREEIAAIHQSLHDTYVIPVPEH